MESITNISINGVKYDLNPIIIGKGFRVFSGFSISGKEDRNVIIKTGRVCTWHFNFTTPSSYPSQPNEYGMYNAVGISNGIDIGIPFTDGDYLVTVTKIFGFKLPDGVTPVSILITYNQGNLLVWMNNDPNLLNCEFYGSLTFYDLRDQ